MSENKHWHGNSATCNNFTIYNMRKLQLPAFNLKGMDAKIKAGFTQLAQNGFKQIFNRIDQLGVKKGVDELGLEKFINQCALLAAGSGAMAGAGGLSTMVLGIPFDLINLITQQFRVTLAITYYHTGKYQLKFTDFFTIVAASLKVDTGMTISKNVMEEVAEKLMLNLGSKTAERLIPVVGAVIGGSANYFFIKRMANTLQAKLAV
ncbi:hypothetical protein [Mucilaginibacter sp.]|uniref:hypothetical protein n=1 Tax=Mucilaginibacter sp. TaxID=1882438 RepID=UPI00260253F0|nr:hypothetical protein [Mucilaginibacter sp.]MDB4925456.1 hypothetical protein [Mucilaginibacter sp.]